MPVSPTRYNQINTSTIAIKQNFKVIDRVT